jgi:2,4-diaminopentanoate dehydrogenase
VADTKKIRLVHVGLGPIGRAVVREVETRPNLESRAAVDVDPNLAARDIGTLCGATMDTGVQVRAKLADALPPDGADVAVLCTHSRVSQVVSQILELVNAKLNVVTSCEELSYPWRHHRDQATLLHEAARKAGVTILATGVNPGFVMDVLPIVLSSACLEVATVHVRRVVDAGVRRGPLQAKIGAGMTVQEFRNGVQAGTLGHRGFAESVAMVADCLGLPISRITNNIEPKLADRAIGELKPGQVAGIDQTARGLCGDDSIITLRLLMYVGAEDPRDRIIIQGRPTLRFTLEGGTPGDQATAGALLNAVAHVVRLQPGLATAAGIPPTHWRRAPAV